MKKIKLYEDNPSEKHLLEAVGILQSDAVMIYPTDSVYAVGCSLNRPKAFDKLKSLRGKKETEYTLVCSDLSQVAEYTRFDNHIFKILKKNLPGPFTFILAASSRVPDKVLGRRKTIGVRIPHNAIPVEIIKESGYPLVSCSLMKIDETDEYLTDPELIYEYYDTAVDLLIDGGYGNIIPTTVVDLTGDQPLILREGSGEFVF